MNYSSLRLDGTNGAVRCFYFSLFSLPLVGWTIFGAGSSKLSSRPLDRMPVKRTRKSRPLQAKRLFWLQLVFDHHKCLGHVRRNPPDPTGAEFDKRPIRFGFGQQCIVHQAHDFIPAE
jgi:hypothetical protein